MTEKTLYSVAETGKQTYTIKRPSEAGYTIYGKRLIADEGKKLFINRQLFDVLDVATDDIDKVIEVDDPTLPTEVSSE